MTPTAIVYLDVDDEITSAAARIRTAEPVRIVLVIPPGSRIATSRINFRLLAREAQARSRRLALVAPDAASRALAASAGLETFASVADFEATIAGEPAAPDARVTEPPAPPSMAPAGAGPLAGTAAARVGGEPAGQPPAPAGKPPASAGLPPAPARLSAGSAPSRVASELGPAVRPRSVGATIPVAPAGVRLSVRGRREALAVAGGILALVAAIGLVAGYLFLPSATIVLRPRIDPVGPLELTITADPSVTTADPIAGLVPARRLTVDVSVEGSFPATGTRVEETKAKGRVTFSNLDTGGANAIAARSIVRTQSGIGFRTLAAVIVPLATILPGDRLQPGIASVAVEAMKAGPAGNVEANLVTVVPASEDPGLLRVRNSAAMSGGSHEEFPKVSQDDVDAALETLGQELASAFAARLAEPGLAPTGSTLFAETAVLGEPVPTVDPATLVDQEADSFELGLSATGTVTAVDEAEVRAVAEMRIVSAVRSDALLVGGSVRVTLGAPVVDGELVRSPVTASARQEAQVDRDEILAEIKGLPLDEARRLLADYGDADVSLWPGWVSSIPTLDFRLDLTIEEPVASGSIGPKAAETPSPAR